MTQITEAGFFAEGTRRLEWAPQSDDLALSLSVEVPNSCYSAGPSSVTLDEAGVAVMEATVSYRGGICAQALQTLQFAGVLAGGASVTRLKLILRDERAGSVTEDLIGR